MHNETEKNELRFTLVISVVSGIVFMGSIGWTGHEMLSKKVDKVELASSQTEQEVRVYEVLIEEAQDEKRNIKYADEHTSPRDAEHIEQLEERIQKYRSRQRRLQNVNSD